MPDNFVDESVLNSRPRNLSDVPPVIALARQVDDVLNSIVGIAPVEEVVTTVRDLMPANVVRNLTGVAKPSEIVNPAITGIKSDIQNRVKGKASGLIPR